VAHGVVDQHYAEFRSLVYTSTRSLTLIYDQRVDSIQHTQISNAVLVKLTVPADSVQGTDHICPELSVCQLEQTVLL
jgi:hypothetical protein